MKTCPCNDILVFDDYMPRVNWPLGRIVKIFPGNDERVLVVEVKTKNSTLIIPITKLVLLKEEV